MLRQFWQSATLQAWIQVGLGLGWFVLVLPLVLTRLETPEIALFFLLSTVASYQLVITFGFRPTLTRLFAYGHGGMDLATLGSLRLDGRVLPDVAAREGTNWLTVEAVAAVSRRVYRWLAWLALPLLGGLGTLAVWRPIQLLHEPSLGWWAWAAVMGTLFLSLRWGYFASYLQGLGQVRVTLQVSNVTFGLGMLISALVLWSGGGLLGAVLAKQLCVLAEVVALAWIAQQHRQGRWRAFSPGADAPAVMRVAWGAAWRSGLGHTMGFGLTNALPIFLAQIAAPAQTASFLLSLRCFEAIKSFANAPFYVRLPHLQTRFAAGAFAEVAQHAQQRMRLSYWAYVVAFAGLLWLGPLLLNTLDSAVVLPSPVVLIVLGWAFLSDRFASMHLQLYTLSNHVIWHWQALGYGVVLIFAALLLFPTLGPLGLALAMLLGYALFAAPYSAFHSYRLLRTNFWRFERLAFLPPSLVISSFAAIFLYAH